MHKILLAEDEKILRDAYAIMLSTNEDYQLDVATNGEEALDLVRRNHYDLILLDLMMPILDGVGFMEKGKLSETSPNTRVIIMSNLSSGEGLDRAIKLGAHRHAVKSDLAPTDVLDIIKEELQLIEH